jgi:hypothetical protein
MKATCLKIIDLPADDPRRTFIDAAIDRQITEALTPERLRAMTECVLSKRENGGSEETLKLCRQITLQVREALVPKDERTDEDIEKWVELIARRFRLLVPTAVRKELRNWIAAEVAAGRIVERGDGTYRRPKKDKSRCRTTVKGRNKR